MGGGKSSTVHEKGRITEENIITQTTEFLAVTKKCEDLLEYVSRVESDNINFRTRLETLMKDYKENGGRINKIEKCIYPIKVK